MVKAAITIIVWEVFKALYYYILNKL